jgi:hypothetical protein
MNWGRSGGLTSWGRSGGLTNCRGLATPAFPLVFLVLGVHGGGECEQQHNGCCPNRSAESGFSDSKIIH